MVKPLAKSVLIPLRLTAAASAVAAGIHKNILGVWEYDNANNIKIWIIKIVKSLEDSNLLLKWVTTTVPNEVKEQKGDFLSMLLGTLGASLLGNILTGQGINRAGKGREINRVGEGVLRASYGNNKTGF